MRFTGVKKDQLRSFGMGSLSFLIPFFLILLTLSLSGIHPFGNKGFLLIDGKLQYVSFFSEYMRQIKAGELPLFSRYFGTGMNFFGTWAYYLSSPVNLLLLLFPGVHILDGITVVFMVKVGLCGTTFFIYTRRILLSDPWKALLFSTAYALNGFVVFYSDNMQWLDGVIWLPILILGIETLYKKGRCPFYPFVVTILILSNFYIAVLTGIACLLYCMYVVFRESKSDFPGSKLAFLFKVGWNSFLGIGMAAFILIPVYLLLKSQMNLTGQKFPYNWYTVDPLGTIGGLFIGRTDVFSTTGYPKLYSGLLSVVISPLYFLSAKIKKRERISTALFLLLVFLCFHLSILNFIWQGMDSVSWFPFRYSFFFVFLLLSIAAKAMNLPREEWSGHKKFRIGYFFIVVTICIVSFLNVWWQDDLVIVQLMLLSNLLFIICWNYFLWKPSSKKLLLFLLCAELMIHAIVVFRYLDNSGVYINYDNWTQSYQSVEKRIEEDDLREQPGRTAVALQTITSNDPLLFSLSGIDYYSSAGNIGLSNALLRLGYLRYISSGYEISDNGGSLLSNSLLGVSSTIVEKTALEEMPYSPIPFPVRHLLRDDSIGELRVLKNPLALSSSYLVDKSILSFSMEDPDVDPFAMTDQLLSSMLGKSCITYTEVPVTEEISNAEIKERSSGSRDFVVQNLEEGASVSLHFTGQGENVPLYLYLDYDLIDKMPDVWALSVYVKFRDKEQQVKYPDLQVYPFVLSLGSYPAGEPVTVELKFRGQDLVISNLRIAAQDPDVVKAALKPLRDNQFDLSWTSSTAFKITGTANKDGVAFISIPYDSGWQATVNGKPAKVWKTAGAFMGIEVSEGENIIEMHFFPNGLQTGIYLSLFFTAAAVTQTIIPIIKRRR